MIENYFKYNYTNKELEKIFILNESDNIDELLNFISKYNNQKIVLNNKIIGLMEV